MAGGLGTASSLYIPLDGDGWGTGGPPGLQTRVFGTNPVMGRFDSYASPPFPSDQVVRLICWKTSFGLNWFKNTFVINL